MATMLADLETDIIVNVGDSKFYLHKDIQSLINKINKSIVAPLPTMYCGAFRGLVKSMLRKNPELRPSAAELLGHPLLQPYVLKIHQKLNNPRRNTLSGDWYNSSYVSKTRFIEREAIPINYIRESRRSFSNDRNLNPSISGTEQDSPGSSMRDYDVIKSVETKSTVANTPRLAPPKVSATPRRQMTQSKVSHISSKRDSLPVSYSPARKSSMSTRRASLPLSTRATPSQTPYRANVGRLGSMASPDVSVNAPRMDKMAEFPLVSSEDPFIHMRGTSSTSAQCSSTTPNSINRSITKDKCMVQVVRKTSSKSNLIDGNHEAARSGSECSEQNPATGVSSQSSSESRQNRFDTSSFQQRAEALEGLLEFSARLLQQERFDELGVLLKPFGHEKVSPRETAIWLTKSFKETTA